MGRDRPGRHCHGLGVRRIGVRTSVLVGTVMIALGLALSSTGSIWALYIGQGLLIGFFGMGAVYPPLLIYVSRWFDRRRGTAIALISSGQYIAGVIWPAAFERLIAGIGWRTTYPRFRWCAVAGRRSNRSAFSLPRSRNGWCRSRNDQRPPTRRSARARTQAEYCPDHSSALPAFVAVCRWQSRRRI